MQYRKYVITLLFVFPLAVLAQDITGLWKGTLYNDTTRQFYKYEIGISKEKDKFTGFSHTWFILDDKQYFGVKKVKIKVAADGKIIVEDDGLISNNYPVQPNKNVRQLNVLTLDANGEVMTLTGPFSTNRTKEYHPLTGSVSLQRKNDFWQSALVPHLQELGKEKELSFVKEETESVASVATDQKNTTQQIKESQALAAKENARAELAQEQSLQEGQAKQKKQLELQAKQEAAGLAAAEKERIKTEAAKLENGRKLQVERDKEMKRIAKLGSEIKEKEDKEKLQAEIVLKETIQKEEAAKEKAKKELAKKEAEAKTAAEKENARQESVKQQQTQAQEVARENAVKIQLKQQQEAQAAEEKLQVQLAKQKQAAKDKAAEEAALAQQKTKAPIAEAIVKNIPKENSVTNALPAANVANRTTVLQQTVNFTSDSLLLSLYDNGEVDGDTVSVLMNGQLILAKQGLSTTAIKKVIYIPLGTDEVELLMYAESLGSIPPNTGLLVVRDGKNLYEVRFKGDLQKNASIVFKRKKE